MNTIERVKRYIERQKKTVEKDINEKQSIIVATDFVDLKEGLLQRVEDLEVEYNFLKHLLRTIEHHSGLQN